ncbi:MAG TPA: TrkH family potassium uptake protein [Clostridia bacterium]|nr:TrkH family potassium uptake protein [Clostridia bacterium]
MNLRAIAIYIGHILKLEGLFMIPALLIALGYGEKAAIQAFVVTILMLLVLGFLLTRVSDNIKSIYAREGFVTVALGWIAISLFGALPFFISGAIPNFMDCWFETMSGFTTTGASIVSDVEALPRGILYWRCFTNWLGGMGVLVFMLAVVPHSQGSGETLHLFRAESPGPTVGKLSPTIRVTTRILYGIYIVMTIVEIVLLLAGGMSLFDALTHSFATAGTGGFSTMNSSIAAYDSAYIQAVIGIFMVLFGINFNIFYLLLIGKMGLAYKNEELRAYLGIIAVAVATITLNIRPMYAGFGKAFLDSFFQVASIMTTTGFATADFNLWPQLSRYILVGLMIIGASAGSTGGGIKVMRLLILGKAAKSEILTLAHPRAIRPPRMDGKKIEDGVVRGTYAFMTVYTIICATSMGILTLDNYSMETTFTSVISCINNIGPGLDVVGPMGNYSSLSMLSKAVLTLDMLFGRLEIFPMIMLFSKENWKH